MVIEHAERQLSAPSVEGRVGRGNRQSRCILLTGGKVTGTAKTAGHGDTTDGFRIADDLKYADPAIS
jgi:RecG-like helicase